MSKNIKTKRSSLPSYDMNQSNDSAEDVNQIQTHKYVCTCTEAERVTDSLSNLNILSKNSQTEPNTSNSIHSLFSGILKETTKKLLRSGQDEKVRDEKDKLVTLYFEDFCALHKKRQQEFSFFYSEEDDHPENAKRILDVYETITKDPNILSKIDIIKNRTIFAKPSEILLAHTKEYMEKVEKIQFMDDAELEAYELNNNSLYFNRLTGIVANVALGTCIQATKNLLSNEPTKGAFCLTRPPGHHAYADKGSGFCIYNNAAVCAKYVLENTSLKRILIFDWDVHHGNGTQSITYDDPHILYVSLFRSEQGGFYPATDEMSSSNLGSDKAKGLNINLPFSKFRPKFEELAECDMTSCNETDYFYAIEKVVIPIIKEFAPQFIIISAGFDAARGDPLGHYNIDSKYGFTGMLHRILHNINENSKTLMILEGGYNVEKLKIAIPSCLEFIDDFYKKEYFEKGQNTKNLNADKTELTSKQNLETMSWDDFTNSAKETIYGKNYKEIKKCKNCLKTIGYTDTKVTAIKYGMLRDLKIIINDLSEVWKKNNYVLSKFNETLLDIDAEIEKRSEVYLKSINEKK